MSDLEHRLKQSLEPVLEMADPRQRISAYHDMPYALFRYDPEEEFELRKQVTLLETRLTQKGKRISRISLAECLDEAMRSQRPLEEWFAAEREQGVETIVRDGSFGALRVRARSSSSSRRACPRILILSATSFSFCEPERCSRSTGHSPCSSS